MWRAYATAMLSCCHGIIDNLYHHLPVTGLRALVNVAPTEEQKRAERRRRQSSAGWFFRHHIVPPTVTTLAMLTVLSPRKRRCYILCRTLNRNSHTITGKAKVPPRPKLVDYTYIHTYIHTYILYIHTYIHTYILYIHTYIQAHTCARIHKHTNTLTYHSPLIPPGPSKSCSMTLST